MKNIIFVQPALPHYRLSFFDRIWRCFGDNFIVYYSPISMGVLTEERPSYAWARVIGIMKQIGIGIYWQSGAISIQIQPGDIVVISGNPRQLSTLVLLAKARLSRAKTIWWGHYWSSTSRTWRQAIRQFLMAAADALMFYTDLEVAEYRKTHFGINDRRPVFALNNGLDTETIAARRKKYIPHDREDSLLFIGRLTKKANLALALDALQALGAHAPHLHVIGEGKEEATLKSRAAALNLNDRITWHGGITNEDEIAAIANRCRAFLYPGEVGLSLIHAMAYGLPAIVHHDRWRHMPEIAAFVLGETGATFVVDNSNSLAKCINDALSDEKQLVRWSDNACQITRESFNTLDMSKRFVDFVNQLMS